MDDIKVEFILKKEVILSEVEEITEEIVSFIEQRLYNQLSFPFTLTDHNAPAKIYENCVKVEISTKTPLLDCNLIQTLVNMSKRTKSSVKCYGAVPGIAPSSVSFVGPDCSKNTLLHNDSSLHDNATILNIEKKKRLKIFLSLKKKFKDLHCWGVDKIFDFFSSREGVEFIISYGENLNLEYYTKCPSCCKPEIHPIYAGNFSPIIGFLTRKSKYYFQCSFCEIVFLNPVPKSGDLNKLYDWYDVEIFPNENDFSLHSLQHNHYIQNYELCFKKYGKNLPKNATIADLGGGTGFFSSLAKQKFPSWDIDVIDFRIYPQKKLNEFGINTIESDLSSFTLKENHYDMITLWEVIEHLRIEDIELQLKRIYNGLKSNGFLIISTPNFNSPLTQALDFWAWFMPHHISVLSLNSLLPIFAKTGFELFDVNYESILLREERGDFSFGVTNSCSIASRAESLLLNLLIMEQSRNTKLISEFRQKEIGTEMVIGLRKP